MGWGGVGTQHSLVTGPWSQVVVGCNAQSAQSRVTPCMDTSKAHLCLVRFTDTTSTRACLVTTMGWVGRCYSLTYALDNVGGALCP